MEVNKNVEKRTYRVKITLKDYAQNGNQLFAMENDCKY